LNFYDFATVFYGFLKFHKVSGNLNEEIELKKTKPANGPNQARRPAAHGPHGLSGQGRGTAAWARFPSAQVRLRAVRPGWVSTGVVAQPSRRRRQ
jgi:hypothetical protein